MKRRRWGPIVWLSVIALVNLGFLLVAIEVVQMLGDECESLGFFCQFFVFSVPVGFAVAIGTAWLIANVILGGLWFATTRGRKDRFCATCGRRLAKGTTTCDRCDPHPPVAVPEVREG